MRDKGALIIQNLFDAGVRSLMYDLALDVGLIRAWPGWDSNEDLARLAYQNGRNGGRHGGLDMLVSFMDGRTASYSQATFTVVAGPN